MKFRLVDRILSWEPDRRIRGLKAVSFEEYGLKGPLGDQAGLPASLVLESLLQLGNWLLILSSDFAGMGLVTDLEPVTYQTSLRPGENMDMEVTLLEAQGPAVVLAGTGRTSRGPVLSASSWRVQRCPLEAYHQPADLRVIFGEIYRPYAGETA